MSSWLTKKFRRITGRFWAFKMLKMREEKQKMQSYSSSSSRWTAAVRAETIRSSSPVSSVSRRIPAASGGVSSRKPSSQAS